MGKTSDISSVQSKRVVHVTLPSICNWLESIAAMRPKAAHFSNSSTKRGCEGSNSTSAFSYWDKRGGGGINLLSTRPVFFPIFYKVLVNCMPLWQCGKRPLGHSQAWGRQGAASWTATMAVKALIGSRWTSSGHRWCCQAVPSRLWQYPWWIDRLSHPDRLSRAASCAAQCKHLFVPEARGHNSNDISGSEGALLDSSADDVGTLKDRYVSNIPLPHAPWLQLASHVGGDTDTCYSQVPRVSTWSDLTRSLAGFGRSMLLPFFMPWLV